VLHLRAKSENIHRHKKKKKKLCGRKLRNNVALYLPEKLDDTTPTNLIYEISIFMRTTPAEHPLAIYPFVSYIPAILWPASRSLPQPLFLPSRARFPRQNRPGGFDRETGERYILPSMINLNVRARKSASDPQSLFDVVRNIGKTGDHRYSRRSPPYPPPEIASTPRKKIPTLPGSVCIFGKLMKALHNSCRHGVSPDMRTLPEIGDNDVTGVAETVISYWDNVILMLR